MGTDGPESYTGKDLDHTVTLTVGASDTFASGNLLITTFSIAYDAAPRMQITPKNANAAALMADGLYAATTTTTTTWTLSLCGTASASQAYIFGVLTFQ